MAKCLTFECAEIIVCLEGKVLHTYSPLLPLWFSLKQLLQWSCPWLPQESVDSRTPSPCSGRPQPSPCPWFYMCRLGYCWHCPVTQLSLLNLYSTAAKKKHQLLPVQLCFFLLQPVQIFQDMKVYVLVGVLTFKSAVILNI